MKLYVLGSYKCFLGCTVAAESMKEAKSKQDKCPIPSDRCYVEHEIDVVKDKDGNKYKVLLVPYFEEEEAKSDALS